MSKDDPHALTEENLLRQFPQALTGDPALLALGRVLAGALERRAGENERAALYTAIDRLPERVLDILARDFKVDWWDPSYDLEEKRRTLKDSWRVHRTMGTKAAVEAAISAIYPKVAVQEWFEYGGKPYHFKLLIDFTGQVWSEERPRKVLERVEYYKSLRSHLERLEYTIHPQAPERLGVGGIMANVTRLHIPERPDTFQFRDEVRVGGRTVTRTVLPVPSFSTR